MLRRVCVFCGSSAGSQSIYAETAHEFGTLLARRGVELVYGGSDRGLMGVLADACLSAGGRVAGVMPRALVEKEIAHRGLTELHVVESMHERKTMMSDLAEAFIAMPGGYGTWEEFFEVLTWSQLGLQRKACGLLNVNGYYDPFLAMAERAVQEGFLREDHRGLMLADSDPVRLMDELDRFVVPAIDKWIVRNAELR
jgi:uncharacterized protein (TIGR00730 family)